MSLVCRALFNSLHKRSRPHSVLDYIFYKTARPTRIRKQQPSPPTQALCRHKLFSLQWNVCKAARPTREQQPGPQTRVRRRGPSPVTLSDPPGQKTAAWPTKTSSITINHLLQDCSTHQDRRQQPGPQTRVRRRGPSPVTLSDPPGQKTAA